MLLINKGHLQRRRHISVGRFWFNGPLRQYFSLYRAVSQRGRKKTEMTDERKNVQTSPHSHPLLVQKATMIAIIFDKTAVRILKSDYDKICHADRAIGSIPHCCINGIKHVYRETLKASRWFVNVNSRDWPTFQKKKIKLPSVSRKKVSKCIRIIK